MKILLFSDEFYTTGASLALLRLAEHLRQEHEVMVMPRVDGDGDIKTKLKALDIPIVSAVENVDLVIANTIMGGDFIGKNGAACPMIWWIHESDFGPQLIVRMPQLAAGFQHAAAVVFQTNYQKTVYTSFMTNSPAEIHVLPFWNNGVYSHDIEPETKEKLRIVSNGTIEPRKRVQDTITILVTTQWAQREGKEIAIAAADILCQDLRRRLTGERPSDRYFRDVGRLADMIVSGGFEDLAGVPHQEILMRY